MINTGVKRGVCPGTITVITVIVYLTELDS